MSGAIEGIRGGPPHAPCRSHAPRPKAPPPQLRGLGTAGCIHPGDKRMNPSPLRIADVAPFHAAVGCSKWLWPALLNQLHRNIGPRSSDLAPRPKSRS